MQEPTKAPLSGPTRFMHSGSALLAVEVWAQAFEPSLRREQSLYGSQAVPQGLSVTQLATLITRSSGGINTVVVSDLPALLDAGIWIAAAVLGSLCHYQLTVPVTLYTQGNSLGLGRCATRLCC